MPEDPTLDPRGVLGVGPGASADEIHAAYRRRSRSAHPDAGGSDEQFRRVQQAYDALMDEAARLPPTAAPVPSAPPAPVARPTAPPTVAPVRTSTSRVGCVIGTLLVLAVVLGIGVLVGSLASSGSTATGGAGRTTGTTPRATGVEAFTQWRSANQALVTALVANAADIGAALAASGGVAVDPLREACSRRVHLLDELDTADPAPRDDVTQAIRRFSTSERRAMASCLATPPDLEGLATEGARGQTDLRTLVQVTQP